MRLHKQFSFKNNFVRAKQEQQNSSRLKDIRNELVVTKGKDGVGEGDKAAQ